MARGRGLLRALVLTVSVAGCFTPETPSTSRLYRPSFFHGPTGDDVIQIEWALLERPVGDPYLSRSLWEHADEQVVAHEQKATLEDNGFRIGQIGGITPSQLQSLLTSERCCVNPPRHIELHAGNPTTLAVGAKRAICSFDLMEGGKRTTIAFEQAECKIQVETALTADGRTRLRFTPRIHHGQALAVIQPAAEGGWGFKREDPVESFPSLSWEVTLAPNEYVLVGASGDRPETLGSCFFVRPELNRAMQRVLVLRTSRPPKEMTAGFLDDDSPSNRTPPLALQTQLPAVRGSRE